jgi:hypothetical protein
VSRLPPIEPLNRVARSLRAAGIPYALGGSALGYALGLVDSVRDWDLTTDVDVDSAEAALSRLQPGRHGHSGVHADHKLVCFGGSVEVICRMAFFVPGGIVRIPTLVTTEWEGHPVGSPTAWAVAYSLMTGEKAGYDEKATRLFDFIRGRVTRAEHEAMSAQPIPDAVAKRLAAAMSSATEPRRASP